MCMQTVSIKLSRSKTGPPNTHTHTHSLAFTLPSLFFYLPLNSIQPFNRAIACSLIFSRCLVPPFLPLPALFPPFLQSTETLIVLPPLLSSFSFPPLLSPSPACSAYSSQRQNVTSEGQAGEAQALPKQKGMLKQMHFPRCMKS